MTDAETYNSCSVPSPLAKAKVLRANADQSVDCTLAGPSPAAEAVQTCTACGRVVPVKLYQTPSGYTLWLCGSCYP